MVLEYVFLSSGRNVIVADDPPRRALNSPDVFTARAEKRRRERRILLSIHLLTLLCMLELGGNLTLCMTIVIKFVGNKTQHKRSWAATQQTTPNISTIETRIQRFMLRP
mmetsp:Transcript_46236/g.145023  ORF Transcript_46236/g.145023 Transcript_46236/m.145023 type:complete len:109 (-) Transcript_46236:28-354(-)